MAERVNGLFSLPPPSAVEQLPRVNTVSGRTGAQGHQRPRIVRRAMDKYKVVIWWSERDGAFLAEMPELPGCMADGRTQEEALANVHQIAREWIETAQELGREIPQPAGAATV